MAMTLYINGVETDLVTTWKRKVEELAALKTKIELSILPQRDFSISLKNANGVVVDNFQKDNQKYKSDWQCNYCQFSHICWKEEKEQILHHKFFIDGKFS